MKKKKILLINPKFSDSFWGFQFVSDISGARYSMINLALPTVAALTSPDRFDVSIQDENVQAIDFDTDAEIVGITSFNIQSERAFAIAEEFRRRGKLVCFGGPYASLCPEECEPHTDVLFVGEAERTWPRFLQDYLAGDFQSRYEEKELLEMTLSPAPRWDLVPVEKFAKACMQTTRGCPFNCEFCDVIVYMGRKVRMKSPAQIRQEIRTLYPILARSGRDSIFIADDNFVGNRARAKEVLKAIIEVNGEFPRPLKFSTQVTVTLARDDELLHLMTEANFNSVFIGIESPRKECLEEAQKFHNSRTDVKRDLEKIQAHGLVVWAGMIVGFDHDDETVFQEHLDFLQETGIPISMTGMLSAPQKTPLWDRLKKEGRLQDSQYRDQAETNIIPKNMTVEQLRNGYIRLMREIYSYRNYQERLLKCIRLWGTAYRKNGKNKRQAFSGAWNQYFLAPKRLLFRLRMLWRATCYFLIRGNTEQRRFYLTVFWQALRENPNYLKEALWHMGMLKHFWIYSYEHLKLAEEN